MGLRMKCMKLQWRKMYEMKDDDEFIVHRI